MEVEGLSGWNGNDILKGRVLPDPLTETNHLLDAGGIALAVILTSEVVRRSNGLPLRQSTGDTRTLFHKVWGSDNLWLALNSRTPANRIIAGFQSYARSFAAARQPFLIYS
jgi:hypothetical protein